MRSAIRIWEYFAGHAKRAFGIMHESGDMRIARKLLSWVERKGATRFSEHDAWKGIEGGVVKNMAEVKNALKLLSERGYLRPLPVKPSGRRGRPPSPLHDVNPALSAANNAKNEGGMVSQDQPLLGNADAGEVSQPDVVAISEPLAARCQVCEEPIGTGDCQEGLPWHERCRPEPTDDVFDAEYSEESWA
jgi:hypothetical protein